MKNRMEGIWKPLKRYRKPPWDLILKGALPSRNTYNKQMTKIQ